MAARRKRCSVRLVSGQSLCFMALVVPGGLFKRGYLTDLHPSFALRGRTADGAPQRPSGGNRFTEVLEATAQHMAVDNPRKLTSLITHASSAGDLLGTLEREVHFCDSIHVSLALNQLARHRRDLTDEDVESPTLGALVDQAGLLCNRGQCGTQEVVNLIRSIATACNDIPKLRLLLPVVIDLIPGKLSDMTAQQLANTCWSVATMYASEPDDQARDRLLTVGEAVLESLESQVVGMKAQEVANTVWSISMFRAAAPRVLRHVPVFAEAAARMFADEEYQTYDRTLRLLTHARLLWGLAAVDYSDERLLGLIARGVLERAPEARGRDLYSLIDIICAFARLGFQDTKVLEVAVQRLSMLRMHLFRDWDVCALAWSLNTLCAKELFEQFRRGLQQEITKRGIPLSQVEESRFGPESWNPEAQMQHGG